MKQTTLLSVILFVCFCVVAPYRSDAATDKISLKEKIACMSDEQKEARATEIQLRVETISTMDKSHLSKNERKELKNELKEMNSEAKLLGFKFIGSLIGLAIIIVLLIILL